MGNVDPTLSTGLPGLDRILRGLMPGDNLVWQVRSIGDYLPFVEAAVAEARHRRKEVVYFRFATHSALLASADGVKLCPLESERGFVAFIADIHDEIERHRHRALYVFDCLSELAVGWNSDRMLGNFFMLVCPHLYDVGAMAYFALLGHNHSFHATRPISETTQILIDVHRHQGKLYVQPLKVQHRHSPTMYAVHAWDAPNFIPVRQSAALTEILKGVPWNRSEGAGAHLGYWSSTFACAMSLSSAFS
jgi:pyruvate, water dikinase